MSCNFDWDLELTENYACRPHFKRGDLIVATPDLQIVMKYYLKALIKITNMHLPTLSHVRLHKQEKFSAT